MYSSYGILLPIYSNSLEDPLLKRLTLFLASGVKLDNSKPFSYQPNQSRRVNAADAGHKNDFVMIGIRVG